MKQLHKQDLKEHNRAEHNIMLMAWVAGPTTLGAGPCLSPKPCVALSGWRRHNTRRSAAPDHWRRRDTSCDVAVGIDLGTTSSAIALIRPEDGQPYILHDAQGKAIVPSVVAYTHEGQVVVGAAAQALLASGAATSYAGLEASGQPAGSHASHGSGREQVDTASYFYSIKRLMGRQLGEVEEMAGRLSYPVVEHPAGWAGLPRPRGPGDGPQHAAPAVMLPQEVGAHVLRHLLDRAEAHLSSGPTNQQDNQQQLQQGQEDQQQQGQRDQQDRQAVTTGASPNITLYPPLKVVQEAVITVPAHFSAAARAATIEAGRMAGLRRVELLQEPIAAALAYGFGVGGPCSSAYDTLLVFDLGGGTFDVSLLEGWDGILEVLMTEGDDELGGDDLTRALADLILDKAGSRSVEAPGLPPRPLRLAATRCAEDAKLRLSTPAAPTTPPQHRPDLQQGLSTPDAPPPPHHSTDQQQGPGQGGVQVSVPAGLPPPSPPPVSSQSAVGQGGAQASSQPAVPSPPQQLPPPGVQGEVRVHPGEVEAAWSPLLQRLWPPLCRLGESSRLQFAGRLPDVVATPDGSPDTNTQHTNPSPSISDHGSSSSNGSSSNGSSSNGSSPAASSNGKVAAPHGLFAAPGGSSGGGAPTAKYVAPPRRLTGVVLVGAATRTPAVARFVSQLCALAPASGADPEEVVALGAALQAGVLSGAVGRGAELTDGGYIAAEHGRSTGWASDVQVEWKP